MVSAVQITHIFNGDNSASDFVDAALLDTQFANIANTLNQEIATRQISISDQGRINNSIVRYTSLHPEVIAALQGIIPGQDVQAVAQTNIAALTGTPIIDGYQTVIGDRVLHFWIRKRHGVRTGRIAVNGKALRAGSNASNQDSVLD